MDYNEAFDQIQSGNSLAKLQAVTSLDDDPDKASRALALGKATDVPAPVVYGDLDRFDQNTKAALTGSIVDGNPQIARYINSNPMAAKVSNDDYLQLDTVSRLLTRFITNPSPMKAAEDAFGEAWNQDGQRQAIGGILNAYDNSAWRVGARVTGPLWGTAFFHLPHLISGMVEGGSAAAAQFYKNVTGDESGGDQMRQGLSDFANYMMLSEMATGGAGGAAHLSEAAQDPASTLPRTAAFVRNGKEPPVGVDPVIDQAKHLQTQSDLANLNAALSASQLSTTRSRQPGMFVDFLRQHTGDQFIGINGDAVRSLYGDKPPAPDDGLLGFVPNIGDQLLRSAVTGADIEVPVSHWLTYADPHVAKTLEPFIRTREGGVTLTEAQAMAPVQQFLDSLEAPVNTMRAVAGIEPDQEMVQPIPAPVDLSFGTPGAILRNQYTGEEFPALTSDTFANVFDRFDQTASPAASPLLRNTSSTLGSLLKNRVGNVPVHIVDRGTMNNMLKGSRLEGFSAGGLYDSGQNHILLRSDQLADKQWANSLVMHEGLHAAFQNKIEEDPSAFNVINHLVNETRSHLLSINESLKDSDLSDMVYGLRDPHEFISEAFSNPQFQDLLANTPISDQLRDVLGLSDDDRGTIKTAWDAFIASMRKFFGFAPHEHSMLDAVTKVAGILDETSRPSESSGKQYGAPAREPPSQDEVRIFEKANAIGMTEAQYKRYMNLINKRREETDNALKDRAVKLERKRQSDEWKSNEKDIRNEVIGDLAQRPDIVADRMFRNGELEKLDTDMLTDDQRRALPARYYKRNGSDPDAVAAALGYSSGDEMIQDIASFNRDLEGSRMRYGQYLRSLIDGETARRMEAHYGQLDQNVIDAAKEMVLSETQLDLLHAETEAMAGGKLPFTKEQFSNGIRQTVENQRVGSVSSDAYIAAAGRAGRATEDALLKGDAAEAFRQRQRQYAALVAAKHAEKVEKSVAQFQKFAKSWQSREKTGALQEYTNQIHDILTRLGLPVKRSLQDIKSSIDKDGYKGLEDFVNVKEGDFRELHVPEFLQDPRFQKPWKELTSDEFGQVHDALKAMAFNARDELKIIRSGEKAELAETLGEMTDKLEALGPPKSYAIDRAPSDLAEKLKSYGWGGIQMESMFNRFDRDDPKGVFNQTLVREYTGAANYKDRMLKEYQSKLNKIGRIPDMDKLVKNDLFVDPITNQKFQMRRRNVLGILQNVGNDSNLTKLAGGYGLDKSLVMQWVFAHTTKEDWDRAQSIGDMFEELFDKADTMSHNVSGVGIQRLPLQPIETPFGTYRGWHNPIKYDPIRPGTSKKLLGPDALEQDGYYRATTPQGYTKGRTGYVAPIELNLDIIPVRMKQMIHDITMRPAIIQLSKFFYNRDFKKAIIDHYGSHQAEQMIPFLRDIANAPNFRSQFEGNLNQVLDLAATNMVSTLIGLNPSTVMKHGLTALVNSMSQVGAVPFAKEFVGMFGHVAPWANKDWQMAMEKSDELARRLRNFQEVMDNRSQELLLHTSSPNSIARDVRSVAQWGGSLPVATSDILSAVPTWLAQYKKAIALGEDEGEARFEADRAVRQAHGSSVTTNRAAIQRSSNAFAGLFSRLYGFFNHILQKQYEIAWRTRDAWDMAERQDPEAFFKETGKIAGMVVSYVIMPAVIEEMVTPYTNAERDSWGMKSGKMLAYGLSSSLIGVRDFVHGIINNRDPQGGLSDTIMKSVSDPMKDLASGKAFTRQRGGEFLKHTATLIGLATGITNAQEGKSAEYIWNYFHGKERPKNTWQALEGLRFGKTQGHSKSYSDWLKQETGIK